MQQRTGSVLSMRDIILASKISCANFTNPTQIKVEQKGQENISLKDMPPEKRLGQASLNIYRAIRLLEKNNGRNENIEQELKKLGFTPLYNDCKRYCCCFWPKKQKRHIIGLESSGYANNPQGNMLKITEYRGENSYLLTKKNDGNEGYEFKITPIEEMPSRYMIRLDCLKKSYPENKELEKITTAQEFINIMLLSAPKQKELEEIDIWLAKNENAANEILSIKEGGCPDKATIKQAKKLLEAEKKLIEKKITSEETYYPGENEGSNKYYSLLEAYQSALEEIRAITKDTITKAEVTKIFSALKTYGICDGYFDNQVEEEGFRIIENLLTQNDKKQIDDMESYVESMKIRLNRILNTFFTRNALAMMRGNIMFGDTKIPLEAVACFCSIAASNQKISTNNDMGNSFSNGILRPKNEMQLLATKKVSIYSLCAPNCAYGYGSILAGQDKTKDIWEMQFKMLFDHAKHEGVEVICCPAFGLGAFSGNASECLSALKKVAKQHPEINLAFNPCGNKVINKDEEIKQINNIILINGDVIAFADILAAKIGDDKVAIVNPSDAAVISGAYPFGMYAEQKFDGTKDSVHGTRKPFAFVGEEYQAAILQAGAATAGISERESIQTLLSHESGEKKESICYAAEGKTFGEIIEARSNQIEASSSPNKKEVVPIQDIEKELKKFGNDLLSNPTKENEKGFIKMTQHNI